MIKSLITYFFLLVFSGFLLSPVLNYVKLTSFDISMVLNTAEEEHSSVETLKLNAKYDKLTANIIIDSIWLCSKSNPRYYKHNMHNTAVQEQVIPPPESIV